MSVRVLQCSGGWGRQSQERPVSVRALQCSGGWYSGGWGGSKVASKCVCVFCNIGLYPLFKEGLVCENAPCDITLDKHGCVHGDASFTMA